MLYPGLQALWSHRTALEKRRRHPTLGNHVVVGSAAIVLGPITLGDGARVGANSIVVKSVPPGETVVGVPGHEVGRHEEPVADPIISIIIGILIFRGAIGLVGESSNILLEAVPKHLDVSRVTDEIKKISGLWDMHDVHVRTITSGIYALSAHLLIEDRMVSHSSRIVEEVNHILSHEFGIGHSTLQLECEECENNPVCSIGRENGNS